MHILTSAQTQDMYASSAGLQCLSLSRWSEIKCDCLAGGNTLAQAMQQICASDQQTEASQQHPTQNMASDHAAMLQRIGGALQNSQQDQALAVLVQLQADVKALLLR